VKVKKKAAPKRKGRTGTGPKVAAKPTRKDPKQPGPRRTESERLRDLDDISRLLIENPEWTHQRIADHLSTLRPYALERRTVSNDIAEIDAARLERAVVNYDVHVARELSRINRLEAEYWKAWEQSCKEETAKGGKTVTTPAAKAGAAPVVTRQEGTVKTTTRDGNSAFLVGVASCIKLRMDLLGLAAPDVHLLGGTQGDTGRRVNFTLNLGDRVLADEGADA
jgi:hypothetical protein